MRRILKKGVTSPGEQRLIRWMSQAGIRPQNASFVVQEAYERADASIVAVIGPLWREETARKVGGGDLSRGLAVLAEKAKRARRDVARPRAARTRVASAALEGTFTLCPLCWLLVYRRRAAVKGERIWHGPCWKAWCSSRNVAQWRMDRRYAERRGVDVGLYGEMPLPPSPPRFISSEVLAAGYRALVQSAAGLSDATIAAKEGCTEQAIAARAKTALRRLPASWDLVFPRSKGNSRRNELCPLPDRLGQVLVERAALMDRLRDVGVSGAIVTAVAGVCETPVGLDRVA